MTGQHRRENRSYLSADITQPLVDIEKGKGRERILGETEEDDYAIREAERNLTRAESGLDAIEEAPTKTQLEREKSARVRSAKLFTALLVLTVLGGYLFTYFVSREVGANAAKQELLASTVQSLEQTNIQRQSQGLPLVDIPAVVDGVERAGMDQAAIVDAVTLNVVALLETDPRFRGTAGATGPVGPRGEPCLPRNEGCRGPAGERGERGPRGEAAPTIDAANFQRVDSDCKVVLTLSDGREIVGEAGEAACEDGD